MNKKPSVSVAIVTRNRPRYLKTLLRRIAVQTRKPDEVIIVENTHEVQNFNLSLIKKYLPRSCKVLYFNIVLQKMSPAPSRNICLNSANKNILMFIDDDVTIGRTYIERSIECFSKFPGTLAITPNIVSTTDDAWSKFSEFFFSVGQQNYKEPVTRESFPTCACSLDLGMVKKTGILFDENINAGEDYLFSKQVLSLSGKKSLYIPSIKVFHEFGGKHPFRAFVDRFNWYAKSALTLKSKYPKLLRSDMKYVDNIVPQRKLQIFLFPLYILQKLIFETGSSFGRYHLTPKLFLPNVIYNIINYYNLVTDKKFVPYLTPYLKKVMKQRPSVLNLNTKKSNQSVQKYEKK